MTNDEIMDALFHQSDNIKVERKQSLTEETLNKFDKFK